jgi:hypothetical protein
MSRLETRNFLLRNGKVRWKFGGFHVPICDGDGRTLIQCQEAYQRLAGRGASVTEMPDTLRKEIEAGGQIPTSGDRTMQIALPEQDSSTDNQPCQAEQFICLTCMRLLDDSTAAVKPNGHTLCCPDCADGGRLEAFIECEGCGSFYPESRLNNDCRCRVCDPVGSDWTGLELAVSGVER